MRAILARSVTIEAQGRPSLKTKREKEERETCWARAYWESWFLHSVCWRFLAKKKTPRPVFTSIQSSFHEQQKCTDCQFTKTSRLCVSLPNQKHQTRNDSLCYGWWISCFTTSSRRHFSNITKHSALILKNAKKGKWISLYTIYRVSVRTMNKSIELWSTYNYFAKVMHSDTGTIFFLSFS